MAKPANKLRRPVRFKYDIFLSHNQKDAAWVEKLGSLLEQEERGGGRKIKVFFSPWDIEPGQSIPREIARALPASRKIAVVMTTHSVKSAWVELETLITTHIATQERSERLIPLYLRRCEIPTLLSPLSFIDFRKASKFEESFQRLVAVIKGQKPPRGSSAVTVSSAAPGNSGAQPAGSAAEKVRRELQELRALKQEGLITEGITLEFQYKLLDKFFKTGGRKTG